MPKVCTNENTASRQRWIENGLLELMQKQEFSQITVTELCRHLMLSRRSFYRYFDSMDDVLDSLMNHTFQEMVIIDSSITPALLEKNYEFWLQRKDLLNALAISGVYTKITQYALKYADAEALKKYLSADDLETDLTKELNLFVISGLSSLLISWHAEGFQKTPQQMAQTAYRMLYRSLLIKP